MTEKNLLDLFNGLRDDYVLELSENPAATRPGFRKSRLALIAAVVALTVVLMGCVVALLRLQDMSLGDRPYTKIFDDQGHYIAPTEKTKDVIGAFVSSDSPIGKAMGEWYEYTQTYDQDHKLIPPNGAQIDVEDRYRITYSCYTPEMAAKIDEIARKYDLKLLDVDLLIQRYQWEVGREALGIESFFIPDAQVEARDHTAILYPPENFQANFTMQLTRENAAWNRECYVELEYLRKDYLPAFAFWDLDLSEFQQWDHIAPDGTKLLLALNTKGLGIIVAEQEDAVIQITVNCFTDTKFPALEDVIGMEGLEQMADCFDYSMKPDPMDGSVIRPKLDAAEETYRKELVERYPKATSFAEELLNNAYRRLDWYYVFYDLNGDGSDELIVTDFDTGMTEVLTMDDGKVQAELWTVELRLLQNGGYVTQDIMDLSGDGNTTLWFHAPLSNDTIMQFNYTDQTKPTVIDGELLFWLTRKDGVWTKFDKKNAQEGTALSNAEANDLIGQYSMMDLRWEPLRDYPMDAKGKTLGQVLEERDVRLDDASLRKAYGAKAQEIDGVTHIVIRDINADGVADLLLSRDGETVWRVYTHRYGEVMWLSNLVSRGFFLCGENLIESEQLVSQYDGAEYLIYTHYRLDGFESKLMESIAFCKADGSWRDVSADAPIAAADAEAIRAKYTRHDIGWENISELN